MEPNNDQPLNCQHFIVSIHSIEICRRASFIDHVKCVMGVAERDVLLLILTVQHALYKATIRVRVDPVCMLQCKAYLAFITCIK